MNGNIISEGRVGGEKVEKGQKKQEERGTSSIYFRLKLGYFVFCQSLLLIYSMGIFVDKIENFSWLFLFIMKIFLIKL